MRLIDADKLKPNAQWSDFYNDFRAYSLTQIDDAPTVEAIPLEWVIKWTEKFFTVINGKKYYSGEGYDSVWDMLADWEKENGKD